MTNFTRKLEKLVKPAILVALFVIVALIGVCQEAKAEVTAEIGAGILSGEFSKSGTILVTERFGGPYGSRYAFGLGVISRQEVTDRAGDLYKPDSNLFVFVQRRVSFDVGGRPWDYISLGIGPAYFNATNRALGSNFTAALSIEFRFTENWSVNLRHFSNAGSARPNMGQDMLTVGYTF